MKFAYKRHFFAKIVSSLIECESPTSTIVGTNAFVLGFLNNTGILVCRWWGTY